MAIGVRSRGRARQTEQWSKYARHIHRSVREFEDIVREAAQTPQRFPHVRTRMVNGAPETFVVGSGLAIWEIAWLARSYEGDPDAIARHTLADPALVAEGLRYAAERPAEVDAEIRWHTEVSLEELQAMLPGIHVVTVPIDGDACPME